MGSGVWGKMDTCVCMAESLCCSPEIITTLLIGYMPYKIKSFFKKKKNPEAFFFFTLYDFHSESKLYVAILYWCQISNKS